MSMTGNRYLRAAFGRLARVSDNFLILIPTDPQWAPDVASGSRALAVLQALAPRAHEYKEERLEAVIFVDQGSNFEEVRCLNCGAQLDMEWFTEQMNRPTFDDLAIVMPCCGKPSSLNHLDFRWPAGFARFLIEARNPGRRALTEDEERRVEEALGHPVRQIWAHY
jgi:hypothetical protein